MKGKDFEALPFNKMPKVEIVKNLNEKVLTAEIKELRGVRVLEIDVINVKDCLAREFFDGEHRHIQMLNAFDGTTKCSLVGALHDGLTRWASAAAEKRVLEFFGLAWEKSGRAMRAPTEIPRQSAYYLLSLIEHGKLVNGKFTANGAGRAGGYDAERLIDRSLLPQNLAEVMRESGFNAPHILLCKYDRKEKAYRCKCSACGDEEMVCGSYYEKGAMERCSNCGEMLTVTYAKGGKYVSYAKRRGALLTFSRVGDTLAANGYEVLYEVDKDGVEHFYPYIGNIYAFGRFGNYAYNNYSTNMSGARYYYDTWYTQKTMRDNWACGGDGCVIMPPAVGVIESTVLKNARLAGYLELVKDNWKQPVKFLQLSARIPAMEVMVDTKDTGALFAALTGQIQLKNGARTPAAAVGLTKAEYKRSFNEKWDIHKLIIYKKLALRGWIASAEELSEICSRGQFAEKVENLKAGEMMNVKKVWFYLNRILNKRFERGIIEAKDIIRFNDVYNTYYDYLRFYIQLNGARPETDDAIYPYDLYAWHDRFMARGREIDRQNKIAKEERNAPKFKAMWEKIRWADYADDTFTIRAARSTAELIDEGDALHHCVGGYTKNVISGNVIFFIRKAGAPDVPYYTLNINIKTGKMIQLHGYANNDRAPDYAEVKAWAEKWLAEVWVKGKSKKRGATRASLPTDETALQAAV